jgi:hypothetical protein
MQLSKVIPTHQCLLPRHDEEPKTITKQQYEEKVMQHLSVQRNYETLSRMMGMKQNEIDSVRPIPAVSPE